MRWAFRTEPPIQKHSGLRLGLKVQDSNFKEQDFGLTFEGEAGVGFRASGVGLQVSGLRICGLWFGSRAYSIIGTLGGLNAQNKDLIRPI